MEKYIEEIIEIVLDNVSCEHPYVVEHGKEGIAMAQVEYSLMNEKEVMKKCLAAIPKGSIDEIFIQEKTQEMIKIISESKLLEAMSFIRSLINEVLEKINLKGD